MTRTTPLLTLLALASACARPAAAPRFPAPIPPADAPLRTAFALEVADLALGTGPVAQPRQCHFVHYTGWLANGTKFDSSRDTAANGAPRTPIGFAQGARRVIAGWDLGFEGMRVGGRRRLVIPWQLAYGERGRPPVIPPKATLVFDVQLMAVADTLPRAADGAAARGPAPAPQCPTWSAVSGGAP